MVEVKVPATSANLGPGFDCLGLALNLYNYFYIEETEAGLSIDCGDTFFNSTNNLLYTSMERCFKEIGYKQRGLKITFKAAVPISRGLGSSAACILGGVLAANEIAGNLLNKKDILNLASSIEGHPDNIAPALFGGIGISIVHEDNVYYEKINPLNQFKLSALIPSFKLSTMEARAVLPQQIDYKDCTFNISRVSLLVAALVNGNNDLLKIAFQDKIHQPYRSPLIENFNEIIDFTTELNCLGAFLSGAGPTIMVIQRDDDSDFNNKMGHYLNSLNNSWHIEELKLDSEGATVNKINEVLS